MEFSGYVEEGPLLLAGHPLSSCMLQEAVPVSSLRVLQRILASWQMSRKTENKGWETGEMESRISDVAGLWPPPNVRCHRLKAPDVPLECSRENFKAKKHQMPS